MFHHSECDDIISRPYSKMISLTMFNTADGRNPAPPGIYKTCDFSHLNWCKPDFWTINSSNLTSSMSGCNFKNHLILGVCLESRCLYLRVVEWSQWALRKCPVSTWKCCDYIGDLPTCLIISNFLILSYPIQSSRSCWMSSCSSIFLWDTSSFLSKKLNTFSSGIS